MVAELELVEQLRLVRAALVEVAAERDEWRARALEAEAVANDAIQARDRACDELDWWRARQGGRHRFGVTPLSYCGWSRGPRGSPGGH